ncbi:hypothetical protein CF327_g1336 [Tilletia walkeri]|nr:hypothetical protein CF327_g1336 [Tilletia walkeri]
MFGKGAAVLTVPLKRRKDDVEDEEDGQHLPVSKLRNRTADRHTASTVDETVVKRESSAVPEGGNPIQTSALPDTTPIHPPAGSVQASTIDPSPMAGPPSVSTDAFEEAMNTFNTEIRAAVEKVRMAFISASASASASLSIPQGDRCLELHGSSETNTIKPSQPDPQIAVGDKEATSVSLSAASRAIFTTAIKTEESASPSLSVKDQPSITSSNFPASANDLNAPSSGKESSNIKLKGTIENSQSAPIPVFLTQVCRNPPELPSPRTSPSAQASVVVPSQSTIITRRTLIENTLKAIGADVGQEKLGLPVTRFPCPSSNFVDEDYPDYGQASVKVCATATTPWIYAGVDFTDPFDQNEFIMPHTYRRIVEFCHWLTLCRKMAADAKQPFPTHLHKLAFVVKNLKRRRGREWHHRITTSIEELEAKGTSADVPQVLDQTKLACLSSDLPTNDRPMCFFLYDAPLTNYAPVQYSEDETLQILQASGWSPRTVLVRAQDIEKIPNWPRFQVFNAGAWLAHRQVLDGLLKSAVQSRQD